MGRLKVDISSLWSLVQIVLIILKVSGILTAPWWVILIPVWLTLGAIVLALGVVAVGTVIIRTEEKK